jgi:hypothetical protein
MIYFSVYDVVKNLDGRIGVVYKLSEHKMFAWVQFGASGPFEKIATGKLKRATVQQLRDVGLEGVNCNPPSE